MKSFILIFTLFYSSISAQFAVVADKDGFTNLRQSADIKGKIIGKIPTGSIVFIDDKGNDSKDWNFIEAQQGNKNLSGFIHSSRLKRIADFREIPEAVTENNCASFIMRDFDIRVCTKDFSKADLKNIVQKNGRNYYKGIEFFTPAPPQNYYRSITGTIGSRSFEIPQNEFAGLFDVNLEYTNCYFDHKTNSLYILSSNSDGSQAYEVLFIVQNGKFLKKLVAALD